MFYVISVFDMFGAFDVFGVLDVFGVEGFGAGSGEFPGAKGFMGYGFLGSSDVSSTASSISGWDDGEGDAR